MVIFHSYVKLPEGIIHGFFLLVYNYNWDIIEFFYIPVGISYSYHFWDII